MKKMKHNRNLVALFACGLLLLTLAASACTATPGSTSTDVIKIGFPGSFSGPYAANNLAAAKGVELYLEQIGSKIGNRKIELLKEDTKSEPAMSMEKVKKMVEVDRVSILIGALLTPELYAVRDYIDSKGIPLIFAAGGARDVTWERRSPYMFRGAWVNGLAEFYAGQYGAKKLNAKRAITLNYDYSAGYEFLEGYTKGFESSGGKIIQKLFFPLTTLDFAPYIANMSKEGDILFTTVGGPAAVRFVNQWAELGMKGKIPVVANGQWSAQNTIPEMKDNILGGISVWHWFETVDTPENKSFVSAFKSKHGALPGIFEEMGYTSANAVVEAMKKVGGNVEDPAKFVEALRNVDFQGVGGKFKFDRFNSPVYNFYVARAEKIDGVIQNKVIEKVAGDAVQDTIYK
ncbi:MAG: ABC transporter substrate-binding protein [Chloroflexi bacterium]|nr:ABC transporter substrate-binding protein [Chloroflexota bacterium]